MNIGNYENKNFISNFVLKPFAIPKSVVHSFFFFSNASRELYSSELLSNAEVLEDPSYNPQVKTDTHDSETDEEEITDVFAKMLEETEKGIIPYEEEI